ncbi:MAG: hypothetical protein ACXVAE_07040, partial [Candidatus Limnocylindrales bacterium]
NPTGSAEASGGSPHANVTPPSTSTDGSGGSSTGSALALVLAVLGVTAAGVLVLAPKPASKRRR